MVKIWSNAFWGPDVPASQARASEPRRWATFAPTMAMVALSLAIAAAAGPLYDLAERAGDDLLDPTAYVIGVLGR